MTTFGTWIHAARLRTLPAAAAPVLVGTALAAVEDAWAPLPALACLVCALLIQIGTNLANDYSDFVRGADAEDRVGEARVTQAGLLTPAAVKRAAALVLGLAVLPGVYLVAVGGLPILIIGLASLAAAVTYTGGPWPYGYRGLGDIFVFAFFGLIAVEGTFYVQAGRWSAGALWAGAGVGALATAILVVNNLRDIRTDEKAGKRTLAVLLGPRGTAAEYMALLLLSALVPPVGATVFGWPAGALLALPSLLLAAAPARRVLAAAAGRAEPHTLDAALPMTARALAAYALLLAAGMTIRFP